MSAETPGNLGVSIGLMVAFHRVMRWKFPNRALDPEKTNQLIYHLGEAERIYETLPEVPGERSPADATKD